MGLTFNRNSVGLMALKSTILTCMKPEVDDYFRSIDFYVFLHKILRISAPQPFLSVSKRFVLYFQFKCYTEKINSGRVKNKGFDNSAIMKVLNRLESINYVYT